MSPQFSIRNPEADMITGGQKVLHFVVPEWARVHETKGNSVGEGSIDRGCDVCLFGVVYLPLLDVKSTSEDQEYLIKTSAEVATTCNKRRPQNTFSLPILH